MISEEIGVSLSAIWLPQMKHLYIIVNVYKLTNQKMEIVLQSPRV